MTTVTTNAKFVNEVNDGFYICLQHSEPTHERFEVCFIAVMKSMNCYSHDLHFILTEISIHATIQRAKSGLFLDYFVCMDHLFPLKRSVRDVSRLVSSNLVYCLQSFKLSLLFLFCKSRQMSEIADSRVRSREIYHSQIAASSSMDSSA